MANNKLQRLLELADKVFSYKSDPNQLSVDEDVRKRLNEIHPMTLMESRVEDGPIAWVLVIPTTERLMDQFINGVINERELFEKTPIGSKYDAIYLCSALVLEEYQRKGVAKKLTIDAINAIRKDHPIKSLFVWPFSNEGDAASEKISKELGLPLYKRK